MPRAKKTNSAAPATPGPAAPFNTQPQPVNTPRGLPYGQGQAAHQAQAAEPMAGATPISSAPSAAPDQPGIAENQAMLQAAQQMAPPQGGLTADTARPDEPVTAGLASGPGAGPEALNMPDPTNVDLQQWKSWMPALEYMASEPNSTMSTRIFVRRLRSMFPAGQ